MNRVNGNYSSRMRKSTRPTVVLITGNFSVVHPGHLRLFRFARECGDKLIVGVTSDKISGSAVLVPDKLRLEAVQSNVYVDEAFILDGPIEDLIRKMRPDVVVKGKEHEHSTNLEKNELNKYGGKLVFGSGEVIFSSLELLRTEQIRGAEEGLRLPYEFMTRHNILKEKLISRTRNFNALRVCVIGDLIIDEYINSQALGMSQEEPTLVISELDSKKYIGGAGIVASHSRRLGAMTTLITVTGSDELKDFADEYLKKQGVTAFLFEDRNRPTTLKKRYRVDGRSLLRVSKLHQTPVSSELQERILAQIEAVLDSVDVLIFSDFNYGCLPQPMVLKITRQARIRGLKIAADSQSSSQVGDITRFEGMDLITPTEREARIGVRNNEDGLVVLSEEIRKKSKAKNLILKLGADGILIHPGPALRDKWVTDRVPALNLSPKDTAGAGDSLLISSVLALASGASIWEAGLLGSIVAAIQVGRVGNIPVESADVVRELRAYPLVSDRRHTSFCTGGELSN
jgi:rfaE bifunctional protein kinase chain/domain